MKKDLIIARWFENKNMTTENTTFGDVVPMVESIAEYYSANSVFVTKEFVMEYFNKMNFSDVYCFLEQYMIPTQGEVVTEGEKTADDTICQETPAKDTTPKNTGRRIKSYAEICHDKKKKVFTVHGIVKDRSKLGDSDMFTCSTHTPATAQMSEYTVVHIPNSEHKPLWIKNSDIGDKMTKDIRRRARWSFVWFYEKHLHFLNKSDLSLVVGAVSICNGELFWKRYGQDLTANEPL